MKKFSFLLVMMLSLAFVDTAMAQKEKMELSTKSKKARTLYVKADEYFSAGIYDKAMEIIKQSIKEDTGFFEAYTVLGDLYMNVKDYERAVDAFRKSLSINDQVYPDNYVYIGKALLMLHRYDEAGDAFRGYLQIDRTDNAITRECSYLVKACDYRANLVAHPVAFKPINMGPEINSPYDEYLPSFTADENTILITRRDAVDPGKSYTFPNSQEDFYECHRVKGQWNTCFNLGSPINTPGNEGAQCISPDGQFLFFTACQRQDGYGSCDIYMSRRVGNAWMPAENIGPKVNSPYWESQPCFSSDGKTLYYISTRPKGSYGSSDIWKSEMQADGSWSNPVNLGPTINTANQENSPFIHPDNKTLYFGSMGHMGMGGFDIFYSRLQDSGQWSKPVNIGYPINTEADENSLTISSSGRMAYYASSRPEGVGHLDLYEFELYAKARPEAVTYFKGKVYDAVTRDKLKAHFELIDLESKNTIVQSESNEGNGEFLVCLPAEHNYALNVSKDGYLFYSQNFSLKGKSDGKPYLMDVPMQPIVKDQVVVLNNIFFDTDKYELRPESVVELEKLVDFLKKNAKLKIEIGGHTDNVGDDAKNLALSDKRAQAVCTYLISKGIDKLRLSYKGYGETKPKADNKTEEGRQMNRRTEFKITAN